VDDQGSAVGSDQQVFPAAPESRDTGTFDLPGELFGYRPAQSRLAHNEACDPLTANVRRDTAAGGFDFGQFRHASGLACYSSLRSLLALMFHHQGHREIRTWGVATSLRKCPAAQAAPRKNSVSNIR
jgi:hypothetical protein